MQNPLMNSAHVYKQQHLKGCMVNCSCGIYKDIPCNDIKEVHKQIKPNSSPKEKAEKRKHSEISQESRNLN
jgi:hypothetical protein